MVLWFIDGLIVLSAVILIAGFVARRRLRKRHPAPGAFRRVGAHRLHVDVRGEGEPTVVFESGIGDFSASWSLVQPEVARITRAVAYDRAGLGWSQGSAYRRTARDAVADLHALLDGSGVTGPLVLVAQSYGALIARLFAHSHPERVVGMVLVDGAHEDQFDRAPEPVRAMAGRMARLARPMSAIPRLLASLGVVALRPQLVPIPLEGPIPEGFDADRYRAVVAAGGGRAIRAMTAELRGLEESQAQLRHARGALGDIPLVVIAHGRSAPLPRSVPAESWSENERLWQQLQVELAALSTRGRLIVAAGSGHAAHVEDPGLVVKAILEVVGEARDTAEERRAPDLAPAPTSRPSAVRRGLGRVGRVARKGVGSAARALAAVIALLFVAVMLGSTYETVARAGDGRAYPPPGRLVDVDGQGLHIDCLGTGEPTVILDAGHGDFSLGWRHIQREVAAITRVCAYDRAGHGWSAAAPLPRSGEAIVGDLHRLLEAAGESPPYVLVGASISAKYVRLYAAAFPDEVLGLVIADGRHESFDEFLGRDAMLRVVGMSSTMNAVQGLLRDSGLLRLAGPTILGALHGPGFERSLGPDGAAYALLASREPMLWAAANELEAWDASNEQLAGTSLGERPLIVLAHGKPLPDPEQERAWQEAQAAQAALSTQGQLVVVEGSGHAIQFDAPEAIVGAIHEVVGSVRERMAIEQRG